MFLVRQPNNLSVNRSGSSCPYLPAPDCNNCLWHVLILSQEPPMINPEANGQNAGAMTHRARRCSGQNWVFLGFHSSHGFGTESSITLTSSDSPGLQLRNLFS